MQILGLLAILFAVSVPLEAGAQQQDYFLRQLSPQGSRDVIGPRDLSARDSMSIGVLAPSANQGCTPAREDGVGLPKCTHLSNSLVPLGDTRYLAYYYRGSSAADGSCRSLVFSDITPANWKGWLKTDDPCVPFFIDELTRERSGTYQLDTVHMGQWYPDLNYSWDSVPRPAKLDAFRNGWAVCRSS